MIAVKDLRKSIRNGPRTVDILKGLDFTIPRGQFAAIMGSSGSGKSTLLGLLAGLDTPSAGSVRLNGTEISYLPEDKLAQVRGKTIGFVFQSYQLIPTLTALENVLLPHELNADAKENGLPRARNLLESVGLGDRMDHYPVQLSGGEQQRVALARAFILHPPIVLADEPTGNLDTTNGAHVLELLLNLNRTEGTTLVLVTHDPVLATYANRRITLRDGLIIADEINPTAPQPKSPLARCTLLAVSSSSSSSLSQSVSPRSLESAASHHPFEARCSIEPAPSWPLTSQPECSSKPHLISRRPWMKSPQLA
jgi:putative ABC transport system ATP-binding protein